MQASRCMCRQAGARTGRQVPMHEGRCPMHEGRCPCMWAGARAGRQVPVQAGRCPHRGAGAWCCTGEWYILFKTPSQVLYTKIHLLVVVTTSLSTVLLDPERLLGEVGTHVLELSADVGGCRQVLADAASSGVRKMCLMVRTHVTELFTWCAQRPGQMQLHDDTLNTTFSGRNATSEAHGQGHSISIECQTCSEILRAAPLTHVRHSIGAKVGRSDNVLLVVRIILNIRIRNRFGIINEAVIRFNNHMLSIIRFLG